MKIIPGSKAKKLKSRNFFVTNRHFNVFQIELIASNVLIARGFWCFLSRPKIDPTPPVDVKDYIGKMDSR